MKPRHEIEQALQRDYYARTAHCYDEMQVSAHDEHQFALAWLIGVVRLLGVKSVLDIGSGTGRALVEMKRSMAGLRVVGVEPSQELRQRGYEKGLAEDELIDGDVHELIFNDNEFDLVVEFATLHHVPDPAQAIQEMLRVAKVGIFISDSNSYGQGRAVIRVIKRVLRRLRLTGLFNMMRTRGRGYLVSEGDGLFYPFSVFDHYSLLERACENVYVLNTRGNGRSAETGAPTVALLALKSALPAEQ